MKKLRITVEGKTYDVEVEILDEATPTAPPTTAPAHVAAAPVQASAPSPAPAATPAPAAAGPGVVPSPLAGRVVTIDVKVGQKVNAGDQLVVLEAMKMNTFINAPQAGTVSEILIAEGDAVEEGQQLIRLAN